MRALSRARRARVAAGFLDRSPRDGHACELGRDQRGQVQLVARSRRDGASFAEGGRSEREIRLAQGEASQGEQRARGVRVGGRIGDARIGEGEGTLERTAGFILAAHQLLGLR